MNFLKAENYDVMLLTIYSNQLKDKMKRYPIIMQHVRNKTTKIIKLLHSFIILVFHLLNFNLDASRLLKKFEIYFLSATPLPMLFICFIFMMILVTYIKNLIRPSMNFSHRWLLYGINYQCLNLNGMIHMILYFMQKK